MFCSHHRNRQTVSTRPKTRQPTRASPVAFGSAAAAPWSTEEELPALACEACEAAVDPALASSDIVANVLRVCVGTHLGVGEFSRQFPASVFWYFAAFYFCRMCVCVRVRAVGVCVRCVVNKLQQCRTHEVLLCPL